VALAVILFFYGANSEVVWLFLLAYWVLAYIAASFFYVAWNRGVTTTLRVTEITHTQDVAPEGASPDIGPFETDRVTMELVLRAGRGRRGPIRVRMEIGGTTLEAGAGLVTAAGHSVELALPPQRRGPVMIDGWVAEASDPLGLYVWRTRGKKSERLLMLPRFASLRAQPMMRELEASVTAPRAGSGTEVFGVRPYQPGDPLRRIHWRSTARRGELIVREFEPPGVQKLGIFLDSNPPDKANADQVARIAASEAWDCLRAGGRVTLWAPGCAPTRPDEERNLVALLEWLARFPGPAVEDEPPPIVGDAIAVTATSDPRLIEAVEDVRAHGGSVRAWVVGGAVLDSDIEPERAGLEWPL
jgi:uncharacterized protein (DUF58 family)